MALRRVRTFRHQIKEAPLTSKNAGPWDEIEYSPNYEDDQEKPRGKHRPKQQIRFGHFFDWTGLRVTSNRSALPYWRLKWGLPVCGGRARHNTVNLTR